MREITAREIFYAEREVNGSADGSEVRQAPQSKITPGRVARHFQGIPGEKERA
jgi:hypothetical protein